MCGILGQFGQAKVLPEVLSKQLSLLKHRGPDSSNFIFNHKFNLYFGHTRLSILDLSTNATQPMISFSGRYMLTFNGEIYNFDELKKDILAANSSYPFRGTSDTEVLLAGIDVLGFRHMLDNMRGMFAIAVFDLKEKKLFLIRDRAGEKPIYYKVFNNSIFFASELKCFSHFKDLKLNLTALNLYIAQGNVPAPYSIYEGIQKLEAGHILEFKDEHNFRISKYWDIKLDPQIAKNSFETNYEIFEHLFFNTLREQLVSDVPLGAFLSGGIDSTCVVSGMQEISSKPIKTHTIAFKEKGYDESDAATLISQHLGTIHNEYFFTPSEAINMIGNIPNIYCEPFSDSSQIPTYFVSKYTKTNVTVSLSGDGGDELFGGYNRYILFNKFQKFYKYCPKHLKFFLSRVISQATRSPYFKNILINSTARFLNLKSSVEKLEKIAKTLSYKTNEEIYFSLLQQFDILDWPLQRVATRDPIYAYRDFLNVDIRSFNDMRLLDFQNYLPNDILTKLDRASMANSLESRVPFLDKRMIDFAFSLPNNQLISGNQGKLMLRRFLLSRAPDNFLRLPKSGFGVPIEHWLRSELKDFAREIIFDNDTYSNEIFDQQKVTKLWTDFQCKKNSAHHQIWTILMLKLWINNNRSLIRL